MQAKSEISRLIDESLKLKRTRTHKRIACYRETSEQAPAKAETIKPVKTHRQALTRATTESPMTDQISSIDVEDQAGTPLQESAIPAIRPRFKAEIKDIYDDQ